MIYEMIKVYGFNKKIGQLAFPPQVQKKKKARDEGKRRRSRPPPF